jgi:hypothetical protein
MKPMVRETLMNVAEEAEAAEAEETEVTEVIEETEVAEEVTKVNPGPEEAKVAEASFNITRAPSPLYEQGRLKISQS